MNQCALSVWEVSLSPSTQCRLSPDAGGTAATQDLAEMTKGRSEYGAAKIRFGNEENPLP
jgi:hypothetical protein